MKTSISCRSVLAVSYQHTCAIVGAGFWITRTVAHGRELLESIGVRNSLFQQYNWWENVDVWEHAFRALSGDPRLTCPTVPGAGR